MLASPMKLISFAGVMALCVGGTAAAQFDLRNSQQQRTAEQLTRMQVISDATDPIMPGETVHIAVIFSIESPWHLYWKNPGEGAMPPNVKVQAPEGFTVGETRWPRPKRLGSPVGDMYCYEGEFALFVPVTAPEDLGNGDAQFAVDANWAVCDNEMCLFGSAKRNITLRTTQSTIRTLQARPVNPMIAKHRQRLPEVLDESAGAKPVRNQMIRVRVEHHGLEKVTFFPYHSPGVTYGEPTVTRDEEHLVVEVSLKVNANNFLDGSPDVGGLIALGDKPDDPSYEFSMPLATW